MPEVELINITKRYGDLTAVDHLNLHVKDGEYFTLVGPTGNGKTTTLSIIAGLVDPDEGEVYIGGRLVNRLPPEERRVGFVFETFSLFPHYDVWNNVIYGPRVRGEDLKRASKIARGLLEMVLLARREDAYPSELSGGMKQRVALVRALASDPQILLLDEPLGALDAKIRMALSQELRRIVKDLGLTAIHVTNNTEEATMVSDRMGILRKGRVVQVGTPIELYNNPSSIFVANFLGETNFVEGVVKRLNERGCLVETCSGLNVKACKFGGRIGGEVVLAVRAEHVRIKSDKISKGNEFKGHVERSQFIHGFMRYEARLETGEPVISWMPAVPQNMFEAGAHIILSFDPEKIRVYHHPKDGLASELAIG